MAPVAISFAVLEHGTASDLGLVSAAGLTPIVLFLLIGGVIADRFSRRVVMLSSDILRTVAEIALGVWILNGHVPLWGFMALAAAVGTGSAFFSPALTGLVPQVVSEKNLLQANALNSLSGSTAQIAGPVLAGLIVAASRPGWAVVIDGVTYAISVFSLLIISIDWTRSSTSTSFLYELSAGWKEFWSRTWLWVIVVEFSCLNVLMFGSMFVLGPVVAKEYLGGASTWGFIIAAEGLGSVAGGIAMLHWNPRRPLLVATLATIVFAWPLFALAHHGPTWMIALGSFVSGAGVAIFATLWTTTMQREIPADILSRVSAYDWFGSMVFMPIGMAVMGPASKYFGVSTTLITCAVLCLVIVGLTLLVPAVTGMRSPDTTSPIPQMH